MGLEFYTKLNYWSKAEDFYDLYDRVLEDSEISVDEKNAVLTEVSERLKKFMNENEKQIASFHLPILKKLQDRIQEKDNIINNQDLTLKKVFDEAIKLTNDDFLILPADVFSICKDYSSMNKCIDLYLLGDRTISQLEFIINAAGENDINEFVLELSERFALDCFCEIGVQKVNKFFQFASFEMQGNFFNGLGVHFDNIILSLICCGGLPHNLSYLNLNNSFINIKHLDMICSKLSNKLKNLKLYDSPLLEIAPFMEHSLIAALTKLTCLETLDLSCLSINDEQLKELANSQNMKSLKKLNLSAAKLTDEGVTAFIQSTNLDCLKEVQFVNDASLSMMVKYNLKEKLKQNRINHLKKLLGPQTSEMKIHV